MKVGTGIAVSCGLVCLTYGLVNGIEAIESIVGFGMSVAFLWLILASFDKKGGRDE